MYLYSQNQSIQGTPANNGCEGVGWMRKRSVCFELDVGDCEFKSLPTTVENGSIYL